jgi:hypothetical protein
MIGLGADGKESKEANDATVLLAHAFAGDRCVMRDA